MLCDEKLHEKSKPFGIDKFSNFVNQSQNIALWELDYTFYKENRSSYVV